MKCFCGFVSMTMLAITGNNTVRRRWNQLFIATAWQNTDPCNIFITVRVWIRLPAHEILKFNIHSYPFSSDANNGGKMASHCVETYKKKWVTPRQGRPKGLCSVYINPVCLASSRLRVQLQPPPPALSTTKPAGVHYR